MTIHPLQLFLPPRLPIPLQTMPHLSTCPIDLWLVASQQSRSNPISILLKFPKKHLFLEQATPAGNSLRGLLSARTLLD
jgi:hypothetical protein